jgi:hypothetical protein
MHRVDASRLDLARQFRARPFGPHGSELQKLLKILRWEPIEDRIIAVQQQRGGAWQLARSTGPKGHPIEIFDGPGYATQAEAQWAIFRRRWERHTGQVLCLEGDEPLPTAGRLSTHESHRSVLGYADRFSVEADGSIAFKVNAQAPYHVAIERLRCGDEGGVGLKATLINTPVNGDYAGRRQAVTCGSYIEIDHGDAFALRSFTLLAYIWPTTPRLRRRQILLGGRGYALGRRRYAFGVGR